jgi:hypothetical protein
VTLTAADIGTIVACALEAVQTILARRMETTRRVQLLRRDIGSVSATAARTADTFRLFAPVVLTPHP